MRIIVTGSLAYDYIMNFPGKFSEHILPEKVHTLSVSFLVDSMKRLNGGTAGNIAYTLALLGEKPVLYSAVGQDFADYQRSMNAVGVDTSTLKSVQSEFTASCFINTDVSNNQIVAFYPGAVTHARELSLTQLKLEAGDWVIISPTDPDCMLRHTQECKQLKLNYIFDPGKQTPRLSPEQILGGIDGCRVLIGNDYEFGMMAKATKKSEAELIALAPMTVVTRGEKGSYFYEQGKPMVEVPVAPISGLVDPTGAGDAFLGGLSFALMRGLPLAVAGRMAALAAAYAVEKKGCQEHRYTPSEFATRYNAAFSPDASVHAALKLS
jgi:adenosine kinase